MTPKTSTERVQALRQRREDAGLRELRNLWVHPGDVPAIREFAARLEKKRAKVKQQGES